ncbi:MAG: acetyl-CoA carboxylase biotin carboxyl carrier protein [Lentisphaerae bacterium]|jgi:acetyl-CoA carboxylase biotin carboxyl carrier protein|nr:acetyl-CoA carboxylase biotin carboxyl carrier protein [Lentisphaerota bacterium]
MEIKEIKRIVELMKSNGLTEFSMKDVDFELTMKRGSSEAPVVYTAPVAAPTPVAAPSPAAASAAVPVQEVPAADEGLVEILSPIVGTFYRKPAPEADPFINVGDGVGDETVVCIVEAMKVMNEIKAEVSGVIKKVLVDDASPVQFGQPLFLVEPQ